MPATKQGPRVWMATQTGVVKINGQVLRYYRGKTVPHDSPLIKALPDRFEMVDLDRTGVIIGPAISEPVVEA